MKKLFALLASTLFLVSCAPPYRQAFDDAATQNNWTKKQELLAFAFADKIFWSKESKDQSGQYVFLYSRVPMSEVASQLAKILSDYDQIQSPRSQDFRKMSEYYNLKKDLEHEEEVEQTIYARVHAADLENQFKQQLGESINYGPEAEMLKGYNIRRIYINKPLTEAFPFKSDLVEAARKDGTLKEIERGELDITSPYDHKDVDPNHVEDPNAFTWHPRKVSIRLINYKIITTDKPQDNRGSYLEGTRIVDGKEESQPCLKIFFVPNSNAALVLLDPQREGEAGFGVPQIMNNMYSINNIQDVIRDGKLIDALFVEPKKEKRQVPPPEIFKIEISRMDKAIDPWQHDSNGYAVPFKYRLGVGDNYNVHIKFAQPNVDPNDTEAVVTASSDFLDIQWIAKEYTKAGNQNAAGPGQVIEYYRPKPDFVKHVKARVLYNDNTKKLEFQLPDGSTFQGFITQGPNKFIEDKPFAVAYTEGEGENGKRWWIEKENSDLYTKRKLVSPPKESTGSYSNAPEFYKSDALKGPDAGIIDGK